jgi:hypothetical protein
MLDRVTMPESRSIAGIDIIHAQKFSLPNGIPLYYVNAGTQDVIKMQEAPTLCWKKARKSTLQKR